MNLLCGLVLFGISAAQPEPIDPILAKVKEIASRPVPAKPEDLAKTLTAGLKSDEDKLAAIQHWFILSIEYDYAGLANGKAIHDAATCYQKRRGVCQAVTALYVKMAKAVGIKAEEVFGESREYNVAENGPVTRWIPHSWVRFHSGQGLKWIDPTYSLPGQVKGVITPGLGWFLLDPNNLSATHRPTRNKLSEEPLLSRAEAELAPDWDWGALLQQHLLPPKLPPDLRLGTKIGFTWPDTGESEFMAKLEKPGGDADGLPGQTLVLKQQAATDFYFSPASPGWHKIQLYVRQKGSTEPYRSIGAIPLYHAGPKADAGLPELYSDFSAMGVEIISGGEVGTLSASSELHLKYKMAAEGTLVIFPQKQTALMANEVKDFLQGADGVWEWKGRLTVGRWLLGARLPGSNRIKFLVLYKVE